MLHDKYLINLQAHAPVKELIDAKVHTDQSTMATVQAEVQFLKDMDAIDRIYAELEAT